MKSLAIFLLLASALSLFADGGIPVGQIERDGLRVTVFAAPVPLRAGPLDVTFLVQEIPSNQPVTDATISVATQKLSPPSPNPVRLPAWCRAVAPGSLLPATTDHSGNRLLQGLYIPLNEPGRWEIKILVTRGPDSFSAPLTLEVADPVEPLEQWWPLIALVPLCVVIYIWHARLAGRQHRVASAQGRRKLSSHDFGNH